MAQLLVDKIKDAVSRLAPVGVAVYCAEIDDRVLVANASDRSIIEIQQTARWPLCHWTLVEYRPATPPVTHVLACEWAILTRLQRIWRSRYGTQPRRHTA